MAHDHHHHHDAGSYYVEQLCTIGVCGTLGGVAITLWARDQLSFLHPSFRLPLLLGGIALLILVAIRLPLLLGGIALLVLVAIRAVVVWIASGQEAARAHSHDHAHDHAHDHDHAHCDHQHHDCGHDHDHAHEHGHEHTHDHGHEHSHTHAHGHDHGHSHGWGPWRYAVLLLPIMFFFLNLPNEGFAQINIRPDYAVGGPGVVKDSGFLREVDFKELASVAYDQERRSHYEGKTIILKGQYLTGPSENLFSLVRLKINCCAADAIPLNAIIQVDNKEAPGEKVPSGMSMKWVQVTGQLQFRSRDKAGTKEWFTVVVVRPTSEKPLGELVRTLAVTERPAAYEY